MHPNTVRRQISAGADLFQSYLGASEVFSHIAPWPAHPQDCGGSCSRAEPGQWLSPAEGQRIALRKNRLGFSERSIEHPAPWTAVRTPPCSPSRWQGCPNGSVALTIASRDSFGSVRSCRAEIVRAASASFAEHCYERASLRDIAARANVTHAALLRHFATKDELLLAALAQRDADDSELARRIMESKVPREQVLTSVLRDEFAHRTSNGTGLPSPSRQQIQATPPTTFSSRAEKKCATTSPAHGSPPRTARNSAQTTK